MAKGQRWRASQHSVSGKGRVSVARQNFRSKTDGTAHCSWTADAGSLSEISAHEDALTDRKETKDGPVTVFRQRQDKRKLKQGHRGETGADRQMLGEEGGGCGRDRGQRWI